MTRSEYFESISDSPKNIEIFNYDTSPDELKKCPFCGGKPSWHLIGNDSIHSRNRIAVIECHNCGITMKMGALRWDSTTLAKKILKKWNTRVQSDSDHDTEQQIQTLSPLEDYKQSRIKCEDFEQQEKITDFLTAKDYEAFDRNYEKALSEILYKEEDDPDCQQNEVERTVEMMKATNWTWATLPLSLRNNEVPNPDEIIKHINNCYEYCLNSGYARSSCSSGGVSVETDIFDHTVHVSFNTFDAIAFDSDGM